MRQTQEINMSATDMFMLCAHIAAEINKKDLTEVDIQVVMNLVKRAINTDSEYFLDEPSGVAVFYNKQKKTISLSRFERMTFFNEVDCVNNGDDYVEQHGFKLADIYEKLNWGWVIKSNQRTLLRYPCLQDIREKLYDLVCLAYEGIKLKSTPFDRVSYARSNGLRAVIQQKNETYSTTIWFEPVCVVADLSLKKTLDPVLFF